MRSYQQFDREMHKDAERAVDRICDFVGRWVIRLLWLGVITAVGLMIWTGIKYEMAN